VSTRRRAVIQLVLAAVALVGCGISWSQSHTTVDVAPVTDGEPSTTSVVYYPPMVVLTLLLATVAGVLTVLAVSGLRRAGSTGARRPAADCQPRQGH
jgi:hypothetical protein